MNQSIGFEKSFEKRQKNPNVGFKVLSTCGSNIFVRIAFMLTLNLSLVVIAAFFFEEGFSLMKICAAVGLTLGIIH